MQDTDDHLSKSSSKIQIEEFGAFQTSTESSQENPRELGLNTLTERGHFGVPVDWVTGFFEA